jgi:hypothetical protein
MTVGRRSLRALLTVGLVTVSCTAGPPPSASPRPPALPGELLTVTATQDAPSLVRFRLSDGSAQILPAPIDPEAVNRATVAGAPDGSLFVTANSRGLEVYQLPAGASDAMALGPKLPVDAADEPLLAIGDRAALVADCDGVWVLPLPRADRWIPTGEGCWAAVAPDGASVVYSPDGRRVFERTLTGGGSPEALFDVRSLRPSLGDASSTPMLVGTPAWGPAGLAFLVRAGNQFAVFLRRPNGEMTEVLQEEYANVFRVPRVAWQPNGDLLAIADDVSPSGAVLRVFDPVAGELRAVTLAPVGFSGIEWAPDGASLAMLTGSGELVVVRPDGTMLVRRDTNWAGLLGWSDVG